MLTQGKQVATVAGHEHLDPRRDRTGEYQVVVGVAAERLGWVRGGGDHLRSQIDEQLPDTLPAPRLEAELPGQDPLQLHQHWSGQHKRDPAVDRLLEDPARRPGRDERRDEDVGVAGDPQDQPRPERISSTRASLSSGPMPIDSARPRP